jgi:predicted nucleotidyltransferase
MRKIKSLGIIAEYNPFHNGHLYHMKVSKELTNAEVCIVAMSGNFVQRGQAAIANKWLRAETAVKCGADLVVEIPVVFACNSASYFAQGSVEILENLGVDYISFGSELGNIEELKSISEEIIKNEEIIESKIRNEVKNGKTYPKARSEVVSEILSMDKVKVLENPNNILALEYLKYMKKAEALTVKRHGTGYNDLTVLEDFASATAIRKLLQEKDDISTLVPQASFEMLRELASVNELAFEKGFYVLLCQKVLSTPGSELDKVLSGGEGLGNKLKNSIRMCNSLDEIIDTIKSKRYTRTRIQRFLVQTLLGIENMSEYNNYIRVLAFNQKGSAYLKSIKKSDKCSLPIITNINKDSHKYPHILKTLEKDILASDIYNLALMASENNEDCCHIKEQQSKFSDSSEQKPIIYRNSDYVKRPFSFDEFVPLEEPITFKNKTFCSDE